MQALLVSYADLSVPGLSSGGARLSKELEETELHQYMSELLDKWLEAGAEADKATNVGESPIHAAFPSTEARRSSLSFGNRFRNGPSTPGEPWLRRP